MLMRESWSLSYADISLLLSFLGLIVVVGFGAAASLHRLGVSSRVTILLAQIALALCFFSMVIFEDYWEQHALAAIFVLFWASVLCSTNSFLLNQVYRRHFPCRPRSLPLSHQQHQQLSAPGPGGSGDVDAGGDSHEDTRAHKRTAPCVDYESPRNQGYFLSTSYMDVYSISLSRASPSPFCFPLCVLLLLATQLGRTSSACMIACISYLSRNRDVHAHAPAGGVAHVYTHIDVLQRVAPVIAFVMLVGVIKSARRFSLTAVA